MNNNQIVQKLWNLCNVLRDDGITYHEYVTELTYILFLKMAEERDIEETIGIPQNYRWEELVKLDGVELTKTYKQALLDFSDHQGKLGIIYHNAQTKIEEPKNLKKIFNEINKLDWYSVDKDDMGDLYEGLLKRNAEEKKSGAGQYFTPRVLIDAIVKLVDPKIGERIFDPAGGTLGFLISAAMHLKKTNNNYDTLTDDQWKFQSKDAFSACELVTDTHRLAMMNALLHDIDGHIELGDTLSENGKNMKNYDVILSNPPFGTKKGGERATRDDLTYETSNKQLNFLQVIYNSLRKTGEARAAVVLPDNVLFESGIGADIRKDLMNKCNLHTILRLPTGIFYAAGVKTNVLFFTRGTTDKDNTKDVWFYDLRSNLPNFNKGNPLKPSHFDEFEDSYGSDEKREKLERWTKYSMEEIIKKDCSLDMGLIKDDSIVDHENLPNPIESADEAISKLEEAVDLLKGVIKELHMCGVGE
jgi:type I restriction enzyme M protein